MKFKKIDLPFKYNELEPFIDSKTVETHYEKHHTTYQNVFNSSIEKTDLEKYSTIEEILLDFKNIDDSLKTVVKNAGGGLYNHNFYWNQFIINRDLNETEKINLSKIESKFGSKENFIEKFVSEGLSIFGSGWVWLVEDKNELKIIKTPNQENPLMQGIKNIIIGIDVWEHAYYLKYKQDRKEYILNALKLTIVK